MIEKKIVDRSDVIAKVVFFKLPYEQMKYTESTVENLVYLLAKHTGRLSNFWKLIYLSHENSSANPY